jgi:NADPH:quinone reductase-like Zn-dependent oxidoreductase
VYSLTCPCQTVLAMTAGRGVDNVVEVAGWATCGKSVRCTRKGGLVAVTGYLSTYNKVPDEIVQQGEWRAARSAERAAGSAQRESKPRAWSVQGGAERGARTWDTLNPL